MAAGTDPTQIQAPGLLKEDGHDLPISPARPAIHDELQVVLDSAPVGPGHSLVRERVDESDRLCPMYSDDRNRTFFGATLMALFNLSPFLNFLEEAVEKKAFNDPLVAGLHRLAQSFRGWKKGEEIEKKQQDAVKKMIDTVWEYIKAKGAGKPPPFMSGPSQTVVMDFIHYLFDRIEHAELQQGQAGGDDVNLSIRFKQLFKFFNVRHTPMRCKCHQQVLRRQPTNDSNPTGYYLNAEVPKSMNLDHAISKAMWEKLARQRICPECNHKTDAVHDFDKFAYLPEVLLISNNFIDKSGGRGNFVPTTDATLTYPERLDMSAFRDDPTRPGDQADCIYKLQSIISSTREPPGPMHEKMYKAALRVSDIEFAQFDYSGPSDSFADFVTFEDVNKTSNGLPSLLVYVRERHPGAAGNPPDVAAPKPTKPPTATTKAVTPTPDKYNLQRFLAAQDRKMNLNLSAYHTALLELKNGHKISHWMWFMFPVPIGVSESPMGEAYSIKSLDEARAYWNHPQLKDRYLELVNTVRYGPEPDIGRLFVKEVDVDKFFASLTLFTLICVTLNDSEHHTFEEVIYHFGEYHHETTAFQVITWLEEAGELEAKDKVLNLMRPPSEPSTDAGGGGSGKQETAGHAIGVSSTVTTGTGPSTLSTSNDNKAVTKTEHPATTRQPGSADKGGHNNGHGTSTNHDPAQRIGSKLLILADEELAVDDSEFIAEDVLEQNNYARELGRVILGFGVPEGTAAPVATPESEERARRLGRHLMALAITYDDAPPDNVPGNSASDAAPGSFGLDGSADGADLDEEDIYQAVAIPTDPRDPRIQACEFWTLDELKREFQKEQLDWRGLRIDPDKHRMKFRKHFELERDYSIYHEGRLRQAIRDRGIRMRHGADRVDKADKAELVDALTEYDLQKLQAAEYVEGDESQTESMGYESEPYESSEASGNEKYYIERERAAALAAKAKEGATPVQPRLAGAAARAQKRSRDEDEDYEEDGGEMTSCCRTKGPVRMRTRY